MIIYNVTTQVDWAIHGEWLLWMKKEHMPDVVATGCFTGSQLLRLLDTDEAEGPTYAAQYFAENKSDYNRYIEIHATGMRQKTYENWGDRIVSYRSLLQVVQ